MSKTDVIVLNNIGGGINIWVDHLPAPYESVMGYGFEVSEDLAKGGNVAVAISRLGIPTAIIGKIGCDQAGDRDYKWLRESGVNCEALIQSPEAKTGQGTNPLAVPMSWPVNTRSPLLTIHSAGAPRHCPNGTMICLGIGKSLMGWSAENLFSSGWTPPLWKVFMGFML